MPTAAKLVAAVMLAAVMALTVMNYIPNLPEGTQVGHLREIAAFVGLVTGWLAVGARPGESFADSLSNGLRGAAIATALVLLFGSGVVMINRSMHHMYDGPMDAVIGVFELVAKYGALMGTPGVVGTLIVGGALTGWLARGTSRRWS